jgi:hypothetical protein
MVMARIKIKDLPKGMTISKEEMRKVFGGRDSMIVGKPAPMYCLDVPFGQGWYTQCGDPEDMDDTAGRGDSGSTSSSSSSNNQSSSGSSQSQQSTAVAGVRG